MTRAATKLEPRRWTLCLIGVEVVGVNMGVIDGHERGVTERVIVVEASAYDALLAERDEANNVRDQYEARAVVAERGYDALFAERDGYRNGQAQVQRDLDLAMDDHAMLMRKLSECRAELAALKEKARLAVQACGHAAHRDHPSKDWCAGCNEVAQVTHPDFLTTSATESREAKGGQNEVA